MSEKLKELRHFGHEGGLCNVVLNFPELYWSCLDVEPTHFTQPLYRHIWAKIQHANEIRKANAAAPVPNLASILHEADPVIVEIADELGGFQALYQDFYKLQCRREHLDFFKEKVLSLAYSRTLIQKSRELAVRLEEMADPRDPDLESMRDEMEKASVEALRLTSGKDSSGGLLFGDDPDEWIASRRRHVEQNGASLSMETGMTAFDSLELLHPGRVTMVLIEFKGGKSSFGVSVAARLAVGKRLASHADVKAFRAKKVGDVIQFSNLEGNPIQTRKVGYIDLEMGADKDVRPRMQAFLSGVPVKIIQSDRFLQDRFDTERVRTASKWIKESGIRFYHKSDYSIPWIRSLIREMVYMHGVEFIVLDYIRRPPGMSKDEGHEWDADLSNTLKVLSEELNVHILTFGQLNREGHTSTRKKTGQHRPTSAHYQGNIKVSNFVDTMLIQDKDPDDPAVRRLWMDASRISGMEEGTYLRMEPDYALGRADVVGFEALKKEEEGDASDWQRRSERQAKPKPSGPPPEPYQRPLSPPDEEFEVYNGREPDELNDRPLFDARDLPRDSEHERDEDGDEMEIVTIGSAPG